MVGEFAVVIHLRQADHQALACGDVGNHLCQKILYHLKRSDRLAELQPLLCVFQCRLECAHLDTGRGPADHITRHPEHPRGIREERHGRRLGPVVAAGFGTLDDESIDAECDRLVGLVDTTDLHPNLASGLLQPFDMLSAWQRPEEDGECHLFLDKDGDVFICDEVADQVDAERPLCECLRLPDKMAQDIGGLMSAPIVPSPPASQTAAARAGRAIIAMPALTTGVVRPKARVIEVESIGWVL
jgi:hypothetical protein